MSNEEVKAEVSVVKKRRDKKKIGEEVAWEGRKKEVEEEEREGEDGEREREGVKRRKRCCQGSRWK